jgi:prephenate dehydrogenase
MSSIAPIVPTHLFPLHNIGIIGCGLMGGSIALACKKAGLSVIVYDTDPQLARAVAAAGIVSVGTPGEACAGRDLVILATPVDQFAPLIAMIRPYLEPDTIVSDIGSVKAGSRALIGALGNERVSVVPIHPMAGSEKSGFAAASTSVIEGCTWLICDSPHEQQSQRLAYFVWRIGAARYLSCDLQMHDVVTAIVSHFPQAAAYLVASVTGAAEDTIAPGAFIAAGGGFRDTTRIAESPLSVWGPIFEENSSLVAMLLRDLAVAAQDLARALEDGDVSTLRTVVHGSHQARARWRQSQIDEKSSKTVEDHHSPLPEYWLDEASGDSVWVDNSMGYETIRTSQKSPKLHGDVVAAYLAQLCEVDPRAVQEALGDLGANHERVASALRACGVDVTHRTTYTADGILVGGVVLQERFLVVA